MNRYLVSLGLVSLLASSASADFLIIKIDPAKVANFLPAMLGGAAGMMGGGPGMAGGAGPAGIPPKGGNFGMGGSPPKVGGFGVAGNGGGAGGQPSLPPQSFSWIATTLEVKGKPKVLPTPLGAPMIVEFDHKWGKKARFIAPGPGQPFHIQPIQQKVSLAKEFEKRKAKEKQPTNELVSLALWALQHGLTKEFGGLTEELKKADPKHPAVANFAKVQAALKKSFGNDDPSLEPLMKSLGSDYRKIQDDAGHYDIVTNLSANPANDQLIKRRQKLLEEVVERFYYWFSLHPGHPQPELPRHRLAVVLTAGANEHRDKQIQWGSPLSVNDAFSSRRDNLVVASPKRLDDVFAAFESENLARLEQLKIGKEELISGDIWNRPEAQQAPFKVALLQMLAITQKCLEEDAQNAAFTHEGMRQLLIASRMAPRNVDVPDWYLSGLASFFETSQMSPYGGFGGPSWSNLIAFKYYRKTGPLGKAPEAFLDVITDKHFHDAQRTHLEMQDATADQEVLAAKYQEEIEVARAAAWALVYDMIENGKLPPVKHGLPQLVKYGQELNQLPRDLELEPRSLQATFGRAFDLLDSKDSTSLDMTKARQFGDAWYARLNGVILEIPEVEMEYMSIFQSRKKEAAANAAPTTPSTGGNPAFAPPR